MIRHGVREYFRLKPPPDSERLSREVDEEIAFHIEQRVRHLLAMGYTEEEARAEAERRFGTLARARLTLQRSASRREYRMSIRGWLNEWRGDFRYTARSLMREPLVSVVIVVTLALGIGANATMFGIIDRVLLRGPAHVVKPEDVKQVYFTQQNWNGEGTTNRTGYVTYTTLKNNTRSFDGVAVFAPSTARIGKGDASHTIPIARVTWDLFPLLGVKPALGRFFGPDEDHPPKGEAVAVLDYDKWRKDFGGSRDVIGKPIVLGKKSYTIVGVAPKGFTATELNPVDVWLPYSADQGGQPDWATSWCCTGPTVIARLKAGVTPEAAGADATRAYRAAALEGKRENAAKGTVSVLPTSYGDDGLELTEAAVTRWLGGVSVIVLIVTCANVVNLLLSRALRRRREISIRLAMGISRGRLTRLLLSEGLLLSIAGGIAAIALAYWGGKFIRATLLPDILWGSPINLRVVAFSIAVSLSVGLLIGLAPSFESARHDLTSTLRATTRQGGGQKSGGLRDGLTILQAALSLVLLVGAGLFVRSLLRIDRLDLGINPNKVLTVYASVPPADPKDNSWEAQEKQTEALNQALIQRLRGRADVENVAVSIGAPLGSSFGVPLKVPGFDTIPTMSGGGPFITVASPEYFATVGTRTVRGRTFTENEGKGTAPVAVVNETMARTLWPNGDPLTKCIKIGGDPAAPCSSIVGIVQDVHRSGIREEPSFQYYVPFGQQSGISGYDLLVRPRGDAQSFIPSLRAQVFAAAPNASYVQVDLLSKRLDPQIRPWKLGATLFIAFGVLALVISGIGLFSVIAYGVTQRRAELGIRMALGARANTVMSLILKQGVKLASAGILIGILLVLAGSRFIEPLLFDTSARDGVTIVGVTLILLATTVVACTLPALRARRIDPAEALRTE